MPVQGLLEFPEGFSITDMVQSEVVFCYMRYSICVCEGSPHSFIPPDTDYMCCALQRHPYPDTGPIDDRFDVLSMYH